MKKRIQYENYPKEITYYLEEIEKRKMGVLGDKSIFEEEIYLSPYEKIKKEEYLKQIKNSKENKKNLNEKIPYIYFDQNFKKEAKNLIREDKQKQFLLEFINCISLGEKKYYSEERFKCYNGFLYSLFIAKKVNNDGQKLIINFGIFFEKTPRIIPYNTFIEKIIFFSLGNQLNIKTPKNYEKILYNFEQNYAEKNNDLEYDKMIFLGEKKERLFYEVNEEKNYYILFPFELATKNEIYKEIKIFGRKYNQGFNMKIWDLQ